MATLVMSSTPPPLPPRGKRDNQGTALRRPMLALPSRQQSQVSNRQTTYTNNRPPAPTSDPPSSTTARHAVVSTNTPPLPPRAQTGVHGKSVSKSLPRSKTQNKGPISATQMFPRRPSVPAYLQQASLHEIRYTEDMETRYRFHSVDELPEPNIFENVKKSYPRKQKRNPKEVFTSKTETA